MNALLWTVQIGLALLAFAGGAYKASSPDPLATQFPAIRHGGWRALGVFEILAAVLLVVPTATGWMPFLTPLAGTGLALESFALAALYGRSSLKLTAANPFPWSIVMGLLAAFVAYGRFALVPLA